MTSSDSSFLTPDSEENSDIDEKDPLLQKIRSGKRSFIYECTKEQLIRVAKFLKITFQENCTVDQLRKTISQQLIKEGETECSKVWTPITTESTMTSSCDIKPFDGSNWKAFETQLECVILLSETKEDKKVPLLITKLSSSVFENLINICSPVSPLKKTFTELCTILKQNYVRTTSSTINRAEFRHRNQNSGESIDDYILELRKLAKSCNFKDIDDQIKEKLIDGVNSNIVKFELIAAIRTSNVQATDLQMLLRRRKVKMMT